MFSIFRKAQTQPAPELVPAAPEVSREAELLAEVRSADAELESLKTTMKDFRQNNFAVIDGKVVMFGADITAGEAIRKQWHAYLHDLTMLMQKRDAALKVWSEVKM